MDLSSALALHQSGRVAEAEAAYRTLLAAAPRDAAVLHAYGVLRHQRGDSAGALPLLDQAARDAPGIAAHHFNHGLALLRLTRFADAADAFATAARLAPDWPEPRYDLGNALHAAGRLQDAVAAYRTALKLRPDFFQAEANLGNALKALGKTEQAIAAYRRVLRRRPDLPELHHNLGTALLAQKDTAGAAACFREAIALQPDFAGALESLGRLALADRHWPEAALHLARACAIGPGRADLLELLGDAQREAGDHAAALGAYDAALQLSPGRHTARFGKAEALRKNRDYAAAETLLRGLVKALPDTWLAHHDLGNALRDQGRFAEAEACYRAALALAETPLALNHLAAVLRDLGRLAEAQVAAERGLALAPDHVDLRYNLAVTHLTAGHLREGLALYEARFAKYGVALLPGRPWTGQDVRGRTVLVAAEQGLGDTIQFIRYIPALAARGARVKLRVPASLLRLLADFSGVADLLDQTDPLPGYDFHVALMSLPHRLALYDPAPTSIPYLAADPSLVPDWRARVAALSGLRVGLAWAGNPGFAADGLRSVPPAALAPLASVAGVSFVSLQKSASALPPLPLADWTGALTDMADTAALIAALDLVISVDTAVAHLAGALGKTVLLLNRFDTCWRWGKDGDASPWYPTLRQCRQTTPGDWAEPVRHVARHLSGVAAGGAP